MTGSSDINRPIQDPALTQRMFDDIAPTYDLLNHLLSFGLDIRWRKRAIDLLREKSGGAFLDIACGSGDLSIEALSLHPARIVATDFAPAMLRVFREKLDRSHPAAPVEMIVCDALALPFDERTFDATMVAFGIRNFGDRLKSLREMHRVLKPGGLALILELSAPRAPIVQQLYQLHARVILPLAGRIISRHSNAYRYLPDSIRRFPTEEDFVPLMAEAGFVDCSATPLTFGTATIYKGRKKR